MDAKYCYLFTGTTTWNDSNTAPESYDPGTKYWNGNLLPTDQASCEAAGGTWELFECSNVNFTSSSGTPEHSIGNYYNWTAALAMNDSSNYGKENPDTGEYENLNTNQSICPAGWTLPIDGEEVEFPANKSFQNLVEKYGWTSDSSTMKNPNIWNSPIKLALSSYWCGGEAHGDVGGDSFFRSSVASSSDYASLLFADTYGDVDPGVSLGRDLGLPVRCVSR